MPQSSLTFIAFLITIPAAADAGGLAARVEALESQVTSLDGDVGALDSRGSDLEARIGQLEEAPPRVPVLVDAVGIEIGVFESDVCLLIDSPLLGVIRVEVRGTGGGRFRTEILQFESNDCAGEAFVQFAGDGSRCSTTFVPEARLSPLTGTLVVASGIGGGSRGIFSYLEADGTCTPRGGQPEVVQPPLDTGIDAAGFTLPFHVELR